VPFDHHKPCKRACAEQREGKHGGILRPCFGVCNRRGCGWVELCNGVKAEMRGFKHKILVFLCRARVGEGLLGEVAQSAKKTLEIETVEAVADKGYDSRRIF